MWERVEALHLITELSGTGSARTAKTYSWDLPVNRKGTAGYGHSGGQLPTNSADPHPPRLIISIRYTRNVGWAVYTGFFEGS